MSVKELIIKLHELANDPGSAMTYNSEVFTWQVPSRMDYRAWTVDDVTVDVETDMSISVWLEPGEAVP